MTSTFFCVKGQSKIRVDFHFFFFLENKTLHTALFGGSYLFGVCISGRKGGGGIVKWCHLTWLLSLNVCVCVSCACVEHRNQRVMTFNGVERKERRGKSLPFSLECSCISCPFFFSFSCRLLLRPFWWTGTTRQNDSYYQPALSPIVMFHPTVSQGSKKQSPIFSSNYGKPGPYLCG